MRKWEDDFTLNTGEIFSQRPALDSARGPERPTSDFLQISNFLKRKKTRDKADGIILMDPRV